MYISGRPDETYMGFSGYRLIAGDRCDKSRGLCMDEPEFESCSQAKRPGCVLVANLESHTNILFLSPCKAQPAEVSITTQTHDCPANIVRYEFFKDSSVSFSQRPHSF
ncbi:hypothetical protein EDC04DRAFT_2747814 [Pisolithus marmoratus]|nr:hypothetical protein EDC04DRAFT_2747814 [Pisolithus marmoratus]